MKSILSISILLFWLVMVGLLIRRSTIGTSPVVLPKPSASVTQSHTTLGEHEGWMGIYHQDRKIGYFHRRLVTRPTGYQWQERSQMKLRVMNTDQTVHTEVHANIDRQYALQDFSFRLTSGGVLFQVTGAVQSNIGSGRELRGQLTTGGNSSPFSFPLQEPLYLPTLTQFTLQGTTLQPGEERRYNIFNPLTTKTETIQVTAVGPETLTLKGRSLQTTKIAERFGGTTVHAWLDQDGRIAKEEAALGLVLLRESQTEAVNEGWSDNTPLDLVSSVAIPVNKLLNDPRGITQLRLSISGTTDATLFNFPPRQHYNEGTLVVSQETARTFTSYQLPFPDAQFATEMAATPFLQSDHIHIKEQAQQVLRDERDARQAVRQLLTWTYTALDKEPTVGVPTALEALNSKKGDCNEHAVLFTALARAAGIPARVAAGVVYMEGAFYYHAWSEVWLGQWVAVDPVLNQFPADATHIKFVQGGPEEHMALLKVIGQIRMEVVEYK